MRATILELCGMAALLGGSPAHAQFSVQAFVPLPDTTKAAPASAKKPIATPTRPSAPVAPTMPATAPPPPVLPPPTVVPLRPMPPPPPPAVVAGAAGDAVAIKDGLRVTFGAGSSDLNPQTDAALRALVHGSPPFAGISFTVMAVAPGTAEDPSTPRRLSLSRALAARSVLISEGVASQRIYVKAMGASPLAIAGGPPDRVDVTVSGAIPTAQQVGGRTP